MFKKLLAKYRNRAGISRTGLAQKVGTSVTYMCNLEGGTRKPPNEELCIGISKALGLNKEEERELILASVEERIKRSDLNTLRNHNLSVKDLIKITTEGESECPYCGKHF
jgi:DNA-binding XRE family transcriptional regulator